MKKKICIYMAILMLLSSLMACNKEDEKKNSEEDGQEVPPTLEQLQQLSDEVVLTTMTQNWALSLDKTKELQSSWNDLYPDLQKKGVKKEDVDEFVSDLNTLMDYLISKNLSSPQSEKYEDKAMQSSDQDQQSQSQVGEQKLEGGKEEDEEKDKNEQKQEEEKGEDEQQQPQDGEKQEDISIIEEEKKDPKKILEKVNPMISIEQENLEIINASVEVTKHIPKFIALFKSAVPPNVYKLKYYTRHLNVESRKQNWEEVSVGFANFIQIWESTESKATDVDEDLRIQLNQNIEELKNVIELKNINLIGVKVNVLIENLNNLIKKIEDAEKEKEEEK